MCQYFGFFAATQRLWCFCWGSFPSDCRTSESVNDPIVTSMFIEVHFVYNLQRRWLLVSSCKSWLTGSMVSALNNKQNALVGACIVNIDSDWRTLAQWLGVWWQWAFLPLEEDPGEAPGGGGGHVPLVGDGHPGAGSPGACHSDNFTSVTTIISDNCRPRCVGLQAHQPGLTVLSPPPRPRAWRHAARADQQLDTDWPAAAASPQHAHAHTQETLILFYFGRIIFFEVKEWSLREYINCL